MLHRVTNAGIFIVGVYLRPALTNVGHIYEFIVTGLVVVSGMTFGAALEAAMLNAHVRQHSERRLRRAAEELARSEQQQKQLEQDFFAMTCHEIRNPLNGLVGSLRLAAPRSWMSCMAAARALTRSNRAPPSCERSSPTRPYVASLRCKSSPT